MKAKIHAKIARKAWPDANKARTLNYEYKADEIISVLRYDGKCMLHLYCDPVTYSQQEFNLLETDSNGNPTMQAKASALDVLVWLVKKEPIKALFALLSGVKEGNSCAAIYEAAKEIVGE